MNLRIQQGFLRGRRIPMPAEIKGHAHFTPGLLKESAFQIFLNWRSPADLVFFDLCSGSGQMGFEAYSRGYSRTILVEIDTGRVAQLHTTAAALKPPAGLVDTVPGELEIMRRDFRRTAARIIELAPAAVFLDPPYSFWNGAECPPVREFLRNFSARRAGQASGACLFIVQGPAGADPGDPALPVPEIRRHGGHCLSIFEFKEISPA